MKYFRLLLAVLFVSLIVSCDGPGAWQVYGTKEFSIEFPGTPRDTATLEGNLAAARTFYEPAPGISDSNVYYSLSLYSLPDSIDMLGDKLDDFFRSDAQIYAWSIGGVLSEKDRVVKSGKTEGREYKVVLADNVGVATIRKFARNKHLYTLLVITENMRLNNSQIEKFMNSFTLK